MDGGERTDSIIFLGGRIMCEEERRNPFIYDLSTAVFTSRYDNFEDNLLKY